MLSFFWLTGFEWQFCNRLPASIRICRNLGQWQRGKRISICWGTGGGGEFDASGGGGEDSVQAKTGIRHIHLASVYIRLPTRVINSTCQGWAYWGSPACSVNIIPPHNNIIVQGFLPWISYCSSGSALSQRFLYRLEGHSQNRHTRTERARDIWSLTWSNLEGEDYCWLQEEGAILLIKTQHISHIIWYNSSAATKFYWHIANNRRHLT